MKWNVASTSHDVHYDCRQIAQCQIQLLSRSFWLMGRKQQASSKPLWCKPSSMKEGTLVSAFLALDTSCRAFAGPISSSPQRRVESFYVHQWLHHVRSCLPDICQKDAIMVQQDVSMANCFKTRACVCLCRDEGAAPPCRRHG